MPAHNKSSEGVMAKLKKKTAGANNAARTNAAKNNAAEVQAKAEQMARSLRDSAQQIWMAGVGAFTRAQGEGSKLFEALVKEGMNIEKTTRQLAGGRVDAVRDAMEDRVGDVRGRASDTWDRLEKVFEDRVQRALNRLGIPGRDDLNALSGRVDALTAQLRKSGAPARAASAARPAKAAPAKRAAKAAPRAAKAPAKAAPRKRTLPRAPRPNAPRA
jgi:poly(hydroxyalkanoate) granule-associated protein